MKKKHTKDALEGIALSYFIQDLVYHHMFGGDFAGRRGRVRVWTVVHGQLIVAASLNLTEAPAAAGDSGLISQES